MKDVSLGSEVGGYFWEADLERAALFFVICVSVICFSSFAKNTFCLEDRFCSLPFWSLQTEGARKEVIIFVRDGMCLVAGLSWKEEERKS